MIRIILHSIILLLLIGILSCSTESTPTYSLTTTASPVEGGEIVPDSGTFDEGKAVSLQAIPAEGWVFVRWEHDLFTTANPMNVTMNMDYNVVGVFEQRMHTLTINIEGEGTVSETVVRPKSTDYAEGTVLQLEAVPDGNWEFSHWEGDLSGSVNPAEMTVNSPLGIVAVFINTSTEVVDVINPATGNTWMDRNLGASRAAQSSTDEEAYGDLYQWGRAADGHEKRSSGTTSTLSNTDKPGHADFITRSSSPYDWRSPRKNNLWQGVDGINNPCPDGYRLPTSVEWEVERQSWSNNSAVGAFSSPLKLPVAGRRSLSTGSLEFVGVLGFYWSSTVSEIHARNLHFGSTAASLINDGRAFGSSVRCLKN